MKTITEINYNAVSRVAHEHAKILRDFLPNFHEQALMSVAWAGAANAVYGLHSYAVACSAKWPVKTDEEMGDEMLAGRPPSGYYGFYATPDEIADALVSKTLPEQLHYCVGFAGMHILDPWCEEVMLGYKEATGSEWPKALALPQYIVGQINDLKITKDYHYEVNIQVSAGVNAIISSLANRLRFP